MTTVIRAAAPAADRAAGAGVESNASQEIFMNALGGFIGTVVTGVIVAALAGAVWRKK